MGAAYVTAEVEPATTGGPQGVPLVVGLDLRSPTVSDADHIARHLVSGLADAQVSYVATHFSRHGRTPHVSLSVELASGDVDLAAVRRVCAEVVPAARISRGGMWSGGEHRGSDAAARCAAEAVAVHCRRSGGRLAHYPGVDRLTGTLTVADLLTSSAIDDVVVLSGGVPDPDTPIVTRDHVRPAWVAGRLVLATERAAGGTLVPFENPHPTPCCVDHSSVDGPPVRVL